MRKKIVFVLAVTGICCTLQANANVQPVPQDSVHCESYMEKELMLQPVEPAYHEGVLITSPWNGNWFVTLQGGASTFIGRPIGCADLFDRVKPSLSASVGKWFTPQVGKNRVWRLAVQGQQPYCQRLSSFPRRPDV